MILCFSLYSSFWQYIWFQTTMVSRVFIKFLFIPGYRKRIGFVQRHICIFRQFLVLFIENKSGKK